MNSAVCSGAIFRLYLPSVCLCRATDHRFDGRRPRASSGRLCTCGRDAIDPPRYFRSLGFESTGFPLFFFLFSVSTLHPLLLLRPLFGRQAARRPGVDGGDLGLERVVDQPVPGEERLLFKVWRHDDRGEGLAAPARHVLDRHVRRVQRVLEFRAQRLGRDAGRGRRLRRRRVGLRGHGG